MPEGDTIFRAARTLHRALAGSTVTRFDSVYPALTRVHEDAPLTGRCVERAEAAGKHLLIVFSGGLTLRTHMRMSGSWHIYRPGEPWQLPAHDQRIVIATEAFVAVAFRVQEAEFLDDAAMRRQPALRRLGPDLLSAVFDEPEALLRLRRRPERPIAESLLDQGVIAGIGNVYKSEVLFLERVHPATATACVPEERLIAVLHTARRLLRANVIEHASATTTTWRGLRRTTRRSEPSERLWVYGRHGQPCRRCRVPITMRKSGPDARVTFWCPACQPEPVNGPAKGPPA